MKPGRTAVQTRHDALVHDAKRTAPTNHPMLVPDQARPSSEMMSATSFSANMSVTRRVSL